MKSRIVYYTFFYLLFLGLSAQDNLYTFDDIRIRNQQSGMIVLGSWAVLNLISSPILANQTTGNVKYFHQMNGYWNAINLLIATSGYLFTKELANPSLSSLLLEQTKMEKILLFNAALDIGYMIGGAYLIEKSKNVIKDADRLKGFGKSLILQGGFLFVFDAVMYGVMHQNHLNILKQTDGIQLSLSTAGFTIRF